MLILVHLVICPVDTHLQENCYCSCMTTLSKTWRLFSQVWKQCGWPVTVEWVTAQKTTLLWQHTSITIEQDHTYWNVLSTANVTLWFYDCQSNIFYLRQLMLKMLLKVTQWHELALRGIQGETVTPDVTEGPLLVDSSALLHRWIVGLGQSSGVNNQRLSRRWDACVCWKHDETSTASCSRPSHSAGLCSVTIYILVYHPKYLASERYNAKTCNIASWKLFCSHMTYHPQHTCVSAKVWLGSLCWCLLCL